MIYITQKASPRYPQVSFDELFSDVPFASRPVVTNEHNTRTVVVETLNERYRFYANPVSRLNKLTAFNKTWESLMAVPREELYDKFYIPKKSGGLREINAPTGQLKEALYQLKSILEEWFDARWLYHTTAFAYIKGRCTIDAVRRHQTNDSRWFLKLDLHDFFGSTTLDFVVHQFSLIYPFSEIFHLENGEEELRKALELAFLHGGLPQGTPISPLITNIMMIPIDHTLSNALADFNAQSYVYTRYADDFIISSKYSFCFRDVEKLVSDTLASFGAPFELNRKKTRYGSRNGSNWNLGVMLNKDNVITVGSAKKRNFKAMLANYAADRAHGKRWPVEDVQALEGLRSYYHMVEGKVIDDMVEHAGRRFDIDVLKAIREDLSI